MAELLITPAVIRPSSFATEEKQALHSWTRISSAGQSVVLEALKILSPRSRDLSNTQELLSFLQELREEGHKATVLRSKDVYGYRSAMSCPLTQDKLKALEKNQRPITKRKGRKPLIKKRDVHPSWRTSQRSNPRIQGTCPPPEARGPQHPAFWRSSPARMACKAEPSKAPPCIRLTSIQGLSGGHTARLQIHTNGDLASVAGPTSDSQYHLPPTLSGIPPHPSQINGEVPAVALLSLKSMSCPIRHDGALIGDSAPVLYCSGRAFPQTHTELGSNGWRANGAHKGQRGPNNNSSWKDTDSLKRKVVKVDLSRSVADARRKAQKILQVNLSPIIQIQPFRHLK